MLANNAAELERHAIRGGKLEVGNPGRGLPGHGGGSGETFVIQPRQMHEGIAPLRGDVLRRIVALKEAVFVVVIERDQRRDSARHAGMTRQGPVFRQGQLQPRLHPVEQGQQRDCGRRGI